ncbi:Superoxide dismutase [Diplonema papillatum]|nr:Superoxide dismutase [Diplonema papillatum]
MYTTRAAASCFAQQCRRASLHFAYGDASVSFDQTQRVNWSMRSNVDHENLLGTTDEQDERVEQLFGVDHHAWVRPVKDASNECKVDPERRVLWEQALYSQCPDLRNDYLHIWSQGVPQKVSGKNLWGNFGSKYVDYYAGMYPNRDEKSPGQYWKNMCDQHLHSHVVWSQEKAKELERFGGAFGLPTDDYQTHNGVMPFLSANAFRQFKYRIHEPIVRELNQLTDGGKGTVTDLLRNTTGDLRRLAVEHQALTLFAKSMYPRGGALRSEFADILAVDLGGKEKVVEKMLEAALCLTEVDGFVWLAIQHGKDDKLVVTATTGSDHPTYHSSTPIAALVVKKEIWSIDYDNVQEYAERFISVFDWDFAYRAYCHALKLPPPEPLVF